MKIKMIVAAVAMGAASSAYAVDTSDVEDISMQPVDSAVELPDAVMKELMLPEMASEKAVERAQNREGYGLSRANEVRGVVSDMPGDGGDAPGDGDAQDSMDDMEGEMNDAAMMAAEDAIHAASVVADATDRAEEALSGASERVQETVANATDTAEQAIENAGNAADQAAEHRPGG